MTEEREAVAARTGPDEKTDFLNSLLECQNSLDKFLYVQESDTKQEEAHRRGIQQGAETHVWSEKIFLPFRLLTSAKVGVTLGTEP